MSEVLNKSETADREILLSRLFNAPRELVFKVWTDPAHVIKWYGPDGFTTTSHEMDVRPGGVWRYTMHGPDGRDYPNKVVFIEVKEPELLTYKHSGEEEFENVNFFVTVTFEKKGNKTLVTMRSVFPSKEDRDRVEREYGAVEGGKQHLANLEKYLESL